MMKFNQKQILMGGVIVVVVVGVIGYYFYTTLHNTDEEIIISQENIVTEEEVVQEDKEEEENQIIVHIAGEVKNPGIVKICEGARIADVIDKAGGLNKEADITNINLAYAVEDGQKITIPKIGEEVQEYITEDSQTNITQTQKTSNKKININKATSEELQTLQGIRRSHRRKNYCLPKRKSEILIKLKI